MPTRECPRCHATGPIGSFALLPAELPGQHRNVKRRCPAPDCQFVGARRLFIPNRTAAQKERLS